MRCPPPRHLARRLLYLRLWSQWLNPAGCQAGDRPAHLGARSGSQAGTGRQSFQSPSDTFWNVEVDVSKY